jgi:hypothetical protein
MKNAVPERLAAAVIRKTAEDENDDDWRNATCLRAQFPVASRT